MIRSLTFVIAATVLTAALPMPTQAAECARAPITDRLKIGLV
jgi:hypothetical protein